MKYISVFLSVFFISCLVSCKALDKKTEVITSSSVLKADTVIIKHHSVY